MSKRILHLDMDAFFASIEQAANPKLKNKPVIVGSRNNKYRTVVAAASYEAKAKGCKSGMATCEALRLCPEAVFVPADCAKYLYTAQKILELLQDFSPQVEMASIDEFYLDITGCEKLFGSLTNISYIIKQRILEYLGLTCSIGIAPNRLMAKLASKIQKPDGLVIWEEKDIPGVLKDMPIERICGIGPKISAYLTHLSIFTCGQLAQAPEALLVERFGKYGLWLKEIARGEDSDVVDLSSQPELPPKSVGHSYTLERDIHNTEALQGWIRLLSEMVAARLRNLLLEGSVVHLYLRARKSPTLTGTSSAMTFSDFRSGIEFIPSYTRANLEWWSKQKKFSTPTFDGGCLYQRSLIVLKNLMPVNAPVRALGVSVSGLVPASSACLFEEDKKRQDLLFTLDKINQRLGDWTIYPAQVAITQKWGEYDAINHGNFIGLSLPV